MKVLKITEYPLNVGRKFYALIMINGKQATGWGDDESLATANAREKLAGHSGKTENLKKKLYKR